MKTDSILTGTEAIAILAGHPATLTVDGAFHSLESAEIAGLIDAADSFTVMVCDSGAYLYLDGTDQRTIICIDMPRRVELMEWTA